MPHLRASAREPSNQRPEHEPGLGCKRDVGGDADDDAERQAQHGSKPDGDADAHVGNGRASARRLWSICCRSARPAFRCRCAFTNRKSRRDPQSRLSSRRLRAVSCWLGRVSCFALPFAVCRSLTHETACVDGGDAPFRAQATGDRYGLNGCACADRGSLRRASVGAGGLRFDAR
jgi:hypothetical protein